MCISDDAKKTLETCPEGVKQFTPKDNKPQGVKLGAVAPTEMGKKQNTPGNPDVEMAAGARDARRAGAAQRSMQLLISEISQTEQLWKVTGKNAADRVTITRRLAETYVELGVVLVVGRDDRVVLDGVEASAVDRLLRLVGGG
ncbi:MAG: hypothetical protein EOO74_01285, partial [Myxococcales bacterium]